ncbi:MAG: hypothetical protein U0176_15230 [Bacteroidia bacterium]
MGATRRGPGPVMDTKHPMPQTPVPGSQIQNAPESGLHTRGIWWMARSAPTTDNSVDTSVGPRPQAPHG